MNSARPTIGYFASGIGESVSQIMWSGVLRQHIAKLRAAFSKTNDAEVRKKLRERIGKLMGGSATLVFLEVRVPAEPSGRQRGPVSPGGQGPRRAVV